MLEAKVLLIVLYFISLSNGVSVRNSVGGFASNGVSAPIEDCQTARQSVEGNVHLYYKKLDCLPVSKAERVVR